MIDGKRVRTTFRTLSSITTIPVAACVLTALVGGQMIQPIAGASSNHSVTIPGASMEPAIKAGTRVIVSPMKPTEKITRGEILILKPPSTFTCGVKPAMIIDRVIGLPGEKLSAEGNKILVNGKPLVMTWAHLGTLNPTIRSVTLGAHQYFVMGDNWPDSCDSRLWGPVSRSHVLGHVVKIGAAAVTTTTAPTGYAACQSDGTVVSFAIASFSASNPGVIVTEAQLLSSANGGPHLSKWPDNPAYYRFTISGGKLYLEAPSPSTKRVEWTGPNSCTDIGLHP